MSAINELAWEIFRVDNAAIPDKELRKDFPYEADYALHIAEGLLEAGYRKPWTISTAAERMLLQPGTICMDRAGNAWKRGTGSWVSTGGDTGPLYDEDDIELTVLHEGVQS